MVLIYVVTKNNESAKSIAKTLIQNKLAYSINILKDVCSYRPDEHNEMIEYAETLLLVKTKALLYKKVEEAVNNVKGIDHPIIFSLPITQISQEMFNLIQANTQMV
ncbi:MAG: divalent cation tolerance protein CutA [Bacteroidetes bacterium]|jgi:uncharacterized protein involved in tolerance to divalent cations|nr:divalent cation tolerance protein CutA [Bacteroidota bacterium]